MKKIAIVAAALALTAALLGCGGNTAGTLKGEVSFMGWGDEAERLMYDKVNRQ